MDRPASSGAFPAVGATRPFTDRPGVDLSSFGRGRAIGVLAHDFVAATAGRVDTSAVDLRARVRWPPFYERAGEACARCGCTGTATPERALDDDRAATSWTSTTAAAALRSGTLDAAYRPRCGRSMTRQLAATSRPAIEDFREFDPRELHLLEALRTLRLIHYSAWIARRWDDPAFPAAFPWFNPSATGRTASSS